VLSSSITFFPFTYNEPGPIKTSLKLLVEVPKLNTLSLVGIIFPLIVIFPNEASLYSLIKLTIFF
jgi:hypothetical protein